MIINGIVFLISVTLKISFYNWFLHVYLVSCDLADLPNYLVLGFLCRFFGIFYVHNHVICKEEQFYFLPLQFICLISFSWVTALGRTSSSIFSKSSKGRHPALLTVLGESIQSFTINYVVQGVEFFCRCTLPSWRSSPLFLIFSL